MIKTLILLVAVILTLGLIAPDVFAEEQWTGNLNFFLGSKALDKDAWEPVEEQSEFGIMLDVGKQEWPVHLAIDLMVSKGEEKLGGFDIEGTTSELDIGVRKPYDVGNMHPFVGVGLGFMGGDFEIKGIGSCDARALGVWADGGVYWTLGGSFNLGFDARISSAKTKFSCAGGNVDANLGGGHFGLLLGYHW